MYPCPAYDRAVWGIVVRCFRRWVVVLSNGRKGGLREYARQIGRAHPQVVQWIQSAEVAKTGKTFYQLFDRTYHLAAIHAAPQELWPVFVEALLAQDWTDRRSQARWSAAATPGIVPVNAKRPRWRWKRLPRPDRAHERAMRDGLA